jgi:hypothetical protein
MGEKVRGAADRQADRQTDRKKEVERLEDDLTESDI